MKALCAAAAASCLWLAVASGATAAEPTWPNFHERDFVVQDFAFASGERLPKLKLHYRTLGTAQRNAAGQIVNAVLMLQGGRGSGADWLSPAEADELFKPDQPLDADRYFIILPDALGRGGSSKPSDGLRAKFPHYRYRDMVALTHRLVTDGLGVVHIRLIVGASLGCRQGFLWAEQYPDLMDGVVGLSCQPVAVGGRNRILRHAAAEAIRHDPDWHDGNYTTPPRHWVWAAAAQALLPESPARIQEEAPTREAADRLYEKEVARLAESDPNDVLYRLEAGADYNPEPDLGNIKARLLLINAADDFADPPELPAAERAMQRIANGQSVLIPAGARTHGHLTYRYAAVWKPYLMQFMKTLPPNRDAK
jgi:homoserine O-acetyltransferase